MLVGAEGAHSLVREYLLGTEKAALSPSPIVASVTMAKLPKEAAELSQSITLRMITLTHPERYLFWIGGEFCASRISGSID